LSTASLTSCSIFLGFRTLGLSLVLLLNLGGDLLPHPTFFSTQLPGQFIECRITRTEPFARTRPCPLVRGRVAIFACSLRNGICPSSFSPPQPSSPTTTGKFGTLNSVRKSWTRWTKFRRVLLPRLLLARTHGRSSLGTRQNRKLILQALELREVQCRDDPSTHGPPQPFFHRTRPSWNRVCRRHRPGFPALGGRKS